MIGIPPIHAYPSPAGGHPAPADVPVVDTFASAVHGQSRSVAQRMTVRPYDGTSGSEGRGPVATRPRDPRGGHDEPMAVGAGAIPAGPPGPARARALVPA
ncbi:hypothetical protein I5Q34_30440 [Streptomyces sp. AV19]|uniref:hypothetical protein n=1 Tax=Streptomyces sp. AV19 TaxID=2793068 RepID=UPI0018FE0E89|nr:hypothetical protein [Streptomyces sp. AV19]MBH1938528.1 hypothetical protein [Streptomyces sp. AV19]MDG4535177.1 hypothetical protein [Streptomyces sp. AV19]